MKMFLKTAVIALGSLGTIVPAQVHWSDIYKSGPIQLQADPSYGRGVDWGSFLFETYKDIAVAEDGTVFMTNSREHTIHKFDQAGRRVLTFGKRGQGPGDLQNPSYPSLLNEKYLVVTEYALNRRISLFDLNGRFFKLLTTQRPVYGLIGLSGTKIAYQSQQFEGADTNRANGPGLASAPMMVRIILKDIESGEERVVLKKELRSDFIMIGRMSQISLGSQRGEYFMARTAEGNLAVGNSDSPKIDIFDLEGKPIRSFPLDLPANPVSPDYILKFKKSVLASIKADRNIPGEAGALLGEIERMDFSPMFNKVHPLYQALKTDSEGNFLLISDWRRDSARQPFLDMTVYSPQGIFLARTVLAAGAFQLAEGSQLRRLKFARTGLYGLAPLPGEDEASPFLFRAVPNGPSQK